MSLRRVCPVCMTEFAPKTLAQWFCRNRCARKQANLACEARKKNTHAKVRVRGGVTREELALFVLGKADKNCGPEACWLWRGRRDSTGYGSVSLKKKNVRTHRLAWEAVNGPIPDGLHVLHRCDTPLCCNPVHLFLGTHVDNVRDMTQKGRSRRGERHHAARLSADVVRHLRARWRGGGERLAALAAEAGASQTAVWNAITGKTWRHVS